MSIYFWFVYEASSGRIELGPKENVARIHRETPTGAIRRLGLQDVTVGYANRLPSGGWRLTTANHEPLTDRELGRRVIDAIGIWEGEPRLERWTRGRWGAGLIEVDAHDAPTQVRLYSRRADAPHPESPPTMQEVLRHAPPNGDYAAIIIEPTGAFELRGGPRSDPAPLGRWLEESGVGLRYDPLGTCSWRFIYDITQAKVLLEPDIPSSGVQHELPSDVAHRLEISPCVAGFAWRRLGGTWSLSTEFEMRSLPEHSPAEPAVLAALRTRDPFLERWGA